MELVDKNYWKDNGIIKPQSIIVCAANKFPDGTVLLGARHWDYHMIKQSDASDPDGQEIQGFIDQFGWFYNRIEAMKVVIESGQPFSANRNGCDDTELYSEGLY